MAVTDASAAYNVGVSWPGAERGSYAVGRFSVRLP